MAKKYDWNEELIKKYCKIAISYNEVLRLMSIPTQGNNAQTLKNKIKEYSIDVSHFTGRAKEYNIKETPIDNYLVKNSNIKSAKLKDRLIQNNIKENKCEVCGIDKWQSKPIIIQLHHLNGISNDNRLKNLQMLCPNCHSQTDNFCGVSKEKKLCPDCGKEINQKSSYCTMCAVKYRSPSSTCPSKEKLEQLIKTTSFVKIGEKYGVSDNAVRKWCKRYNLPYRKRDIKII